MKNIYILSGLGADERVFAHLDFSGFNIAFIQWISPLDHETIEHYANRLRVQIKTDNPVLIGLSFGGMMAIEIAKQIKTEKVILISSIKTQKEVPSYYRLAGKLGLHKLVPSNLLKTPNALTNWLFGAHTREEKFILNNILKETDKKYLRWAIHNIVTWTNQPKIENLKHIHGTADRVLPLRFIQADKQINNGGHLMILNRADEVMEFIRGELK